MTHRTEGEHQVPAWALGDPLMEWYATTIWGKRIDVDDTLFEIMSLQIFQAGLNWRMICDGRASWAKTDHTRAPRTLFHPLPLPGHVPL